MCPPLDSRLFTWKVIVGAFLLLGLAGILLWQLGPKFGFQAKTQVVDTLSLEDLSRVFLVRCRTDSSFLEPYHVILVRLYADHRAEVAVVDFGCSYWWLSKLQSDPSGGSIEIRALGKLECRYHLASSALVWPSGKNRPMKACASPAGWLERLEQHPVR